MTPDCFFVGFLIIGIAAFMVGLADGDLRERDLPHIVGDGVCILIAVIGVCYFTYRAFTRLRTGLKKAQRSAGDHVLEVKKDQ